MRMQKQTAFTWAATLIGVAAVLYSSWPLGFWLNPSAMRSGLASELGAFGQPYNWFFIAADVVSGMLLLAATVLLQRYLKLKSWARVTMVLLSIYGICGAVDAVLPLQCLPSLQVCGPVLNDPLLILHGASDLLGSIALIGTLVSAGIHVYRHNREWLSWIYTIGLGGTIFAVASGLLYIVHGPGFWAQRYYITLSSLWVISIPFVLCMKRTTMRRLDRVMLHDK